MKTRFRAVLVALVTSLCALALVPAAVADGEWWRLFTSGFLHIGPLHIAFNMYALWVLGRDLELVLGRARFLALLPYVAK